jgi:hypothetical protein
MSHTPGPWRVYQEHNVAYGDDSDHVVRMVHAHHPLVAATEESRANARLIAAAPDMLRFLETLLENVGQKRLLNPHWVRRRVAELVAQARGG